MQRLLFGNGKQVIYIIFNYAGIVNFKFKDFDAAVEDLSACVKLDEDNKSAYTYLVSPECPMHYSF